MSTVPPAEGFPAGEFLADELHEHGWSQADFAEVLGYPIQDVSEMISSEQAITRESSRAIGAVLGTSTEFWLNLQDTYWLWEQTQNSET